LQEFGSNEVQMGVWQMKQKKLDEEKARHAWPPQDTSLPSWTWAEVSKRVSAGDKLLVLQGHVVGVADWIAQHPGGPVLNEYIGKDATEAFERSGHAHSQEARGLAQMRRCAVLVGADQPASHEKTA